MTWPRRLAIAASALLLAVLVSVGAWLGPWIRDDQVLDGVVRAVALDWRDFGEDAARRRLQYELDHQAIGLQVGDDHCRFEQPEPEVRVVRCAWTIDATVPLTSVALPLSFESVARIEPDGDLR